MQELIDKLRRLNMMTYDYEVRKDDYTDEQLKKIQTSDYDKKIEDRKNENLKKCETLEKAEDELERHKRLKDKIESQKKEWSDVASSFDYFVKNFANKYTLDKLYSMDNKTGYDYEMNKIDLMRKYVDDHVDMHSGKYYSTQPMKTGALKGIEEETKQKLHQKIDEYKDSVDKAKRYSLPSSPLLSTDIGETHILKDFYNMNPNDWKDSVNLLDTDADKKPEKHTNGLRKKDLMALNTEAKQESQFKPKNKEQIAAEKKAHNEKVKQQYKIKPKDKEKVKTQVVDAIDRFRMKKSSKIDEVSNLFSLLSDYKDTIKPNIFKKSKVEKPRLEYVEQLSKSKKYLNRTDIIIVSRKVDEFLKYLDSL